MDQIRADAGAVLPAAAARWSDVDVAAHAVALDELAGASAPLIFRDGDGRWRAGAYAGSLSRDGSTLLLDPVIGWPALEGWVRAAVDLPDTRSGAEGLAWMLALIWARAVDDASRHGPPAFRDEVEHQGASVRGRLDVRSTVAIRSRGGSGVASVRRERQLDNPVTRIIVAADRVLARQTGDRRWHTKRMIGVIPPLHAVVGRRAAVPSTQELQRMRYTPITRPYKSTAEISARIVNADSVLNTDVPGVARGVLLDLRSIRLGAVVAWVRAARPDLRVEPQAGATLAVHGGRREERLAVRVGAPEKSWVLQARNAEVELPADPSTAERAVTALATSL